jgi:hypothetical protein
MSALLCVVFLLHAPEAAVLAGQVVDSEGQPIAGASVYAEPDITGALLDTRSDEAGRFFFSEPLNGAVGVFAIAEGYGFGGHHVNLAVEQRETGLRIVLAPKDEVSGKVTNQYNKGVKGASITRVALLGKQKVGIPLVKLAAFGHSLPVSGAKGRFTLRHMPKGESIILKAVHREYAQVSVADLKVGASDVKVAMQPGVAIDGAVFAPGTGHPLGGAWVLIRNALPPKDTAVAQCDPMGMFSLRLMPGYYDCQVMGGGIQSVGWERVTIEDDHGVVPLRLTAASVAELDGEVRDAKTGEPLEGARIFVRHQEKVSGIQFSGPSGKYHMLIPAAEVVVRVEPPVGYLSDISGGTRFVASAGQKTVLPVFWLTPISAIPLQVRDEDNAPVAKAIASVARPRQLGWQNSDEAGNLDLRIAKWPAAGLTGVVESPDGSLGGFVSISRTEVQGKTVQLHPWAEIKGRVVDSQGKAVAGALVGGIPAEDDPDQPTLLWRCITDKSGRFQWPAVVSGVAQRCVSISAGRVILSRGFTPTPGQKVALENLVLPEADSGKSLRGLELPWRGLTHLAGPAPPAAGESRTLVLYCSEEEAPIAAGALSAARESLRAVGMNCALAVDGNFTDSTELTILQGRAPGTATTYVLDAKDRVHVETHGLPSLAAVIK